VEAAAASEIAIFYPFCVTRNNSVSSPDTKVHTYPVTRMRDAVLTPIEAALHHLNQNWTEPSTVLPLDDERLFERAATAILKAAQTDDASEHTLLLAPENDESAEQFIERVRSADTATAIHVDMAAKRVPPQGMAVLMPVAAVRREAVAGVCNALVSRAGLIDTLDLSGNTVTADAMLAIAECIAARGIRHLILPGLIGIDSVDTKHFIDRLTNSDSSSSSSDSSTQCQQHAETLTLNLSNAKLSAVGVAMLGQLSSTGAFSSVRVLNLSNCFIGGMSGNGPLVQPLNEALAASDHITELDISRNNLSDAAIACIVDTAVHQCSSLRALNVNTNIVKGTAARALGQLLGTNRMTSLSIASCSLNEASLALLSQAALEAFNDFLKSQTLSAIVPALGCDLDLSYTRFNVSGLNALSALLQKRTPDCVKITGLRLRCCDMTAVLNSAAAGLALYCIYSAKYLQIVDLSGTQLSDIAALHFLNELERFWELSSGMHADTADTTITTTTQNSDDAVADTTVTGIEPPIAALNMSRCGISVLVTERLASLLQRAARRFVNKHPVRVLCLRQANTGVRGVAAIKRWLDIDASIQLVQLGDRNTSIETTTNTTDTADQVSLLNSIESTTVLQYQLWPLCKKVALISCCTTGNSGDNTVLPQDALLLIFKYLQTPIIRRVVKDSA
jgi:Ran GTPase-activating protein (RanGAP) involved in mRNA processing and transport